MRNWIWSEKIHYNSWAECLFIENRKVFWQKLSSLCCTNWGLLSFATESENIDNRAAFWYFSHENSSLLLWHHLGDFTFSECKSIKIWATPCVLDFSAGLNFKFRKFDKLSETSPPSGWYTLQANLVHIFIDVVQFFDLREGEILMWVISRDETSRVASHCSSWGGKSFLILGVTLLHRVHLAQVQDIGSNIQNFRGGSTLQNNSFNHTLNAFICMGAGRTLFSNAFCKINILLYKVMINLKFYSIPLTVIINPQSKTERPIRNILYDKNTLFCELIGRQNVFMFFIWDLLPHISDFKVMHIS